MTYQFDAVRWCKARARTARAVRNFADENSFVQVAREVEELRARLAEVEAQRDVYKEAALGFRDGLRLIHSGDHEDKPHSVAGHVLRVQGKALAKLEEK